VLDEEPELFKPTFTLRVALSIREKLQEPVGWWSCALRANEYTLIPSAGVWVKCWYGWT